MGIAASCSGCRMPLADTDPRIPCPRCGSARRTFENQIVEILAVGEASFRLRQKRPGIPGWLLSIVDRFKTSRHGHRAKEVLIIDRSARDKTVKYHQVQEQQPDGSWQEVHKHQPEFPARRRGEVR